jgi:hypothetical protein
MTTSERSILVLLVGSSWLSGECASCSDPRRTMNVSGLTQQFLIWSWFLDKIILSSNNFFFLLNLMAHDTLMADCFIACFSVRSFGLVYLHHHHYHHRQNTPFLAIAFLGRFCPIPSDFHVFGFRNSNLFTEQVLQSCVQPPMWMTRFVYLCPPVTGWRSYTPRYLVPFSSRSTTFTEPLPSNDREIFTNPLLSNDMGIHIYTDWWDDLWNTLLRWVQLPWYAYQVS